MTRMQTLCIPTLLVWFSLLWGVLPQTAFGFGDCIATSCTAPPLSCTNLGPTSGGVSNCGTTCNNGTFNNYCQVTSLATCTNLSAPSTKICGGVCSYTKPLGSCIANPALSCGTGETGPGYSYYCPAIACTATAAACPGTYTGYGFVLPDDPVYSFPTVKDSDGKPLYPNPDTKDFLGLAAKGNVVIGDYTSDAFKTNALPNIKPKSPDNPNSKTQAYVIDPTDADLGYYTGKGGMMTDSQGRPLFDGNYDQQDKDGASPGIKSDGSPRKFYESSLDDATFKSKLSMPANSTVSIDAAVFTNHALAGMTPGSLIVNGAIVSRDDGLVYNGTMIVDHDTRLLGGTTGQQVVLPLTLHRPSLVGWKDCSPAPCQ